MEFEYALSCAVWAATCTTRVAVCPFNLGVTERRRAQPALQKQLHGRPGKNIGRYKAITSLFTDERKPSWQKGRQRVHFGVAVVLSSRGRGSAHSQLSVSFDGMHMFGTYSN
jgi:hypothetical protein